MDEARINRAVGAELRAARARRGWSRAELVKRSGVSAPSLQRYENGTRSVPVDTLVHLASILDMDGGDIARAIQQATAEQRSSPDDGEAAVLVDKLGPAAAADVIARKTVAELKANRRVDDAK